MNLLLRLRTANLPRSTAPYFFSTFQNTGAGAGRIPLTFERTATALGWSVRSALRFPDHHHYVDDDVRAIAAMTLAHQATAVVTTKDAVKLAAFIPARSSSSPMLVLRTRMRLPAEDDQQLDRLLSRAIAACSA